MKTKEMNFKTVKRFFSVLFVTAMLFLVSAPAFAHCDSYDGPVIKDATIALETNNVNLVLKWITKEQEQEIREESRNRMMLLSAAREGDSKAIESLTMEDMDLYSQVSRRIQTEDIYSIVDTYFMPCGVECDQYSILGEILDIDTVENKLTKEEIYVFTVDVNELRFDICVPVKSVLGEPAIGRRIKADIWLQGKINL